MKNRIPRKLKKHAKKRKAIADAIVLSQCAISSVMSAAQLAMISSSPILQDSDRISKVLRIVEVAKNAAEIISRHTQQIKPWQHFARWK